MGLLIGKNVGPESVLAKPDVMFRQNLR